MSATVANTSRNILKLGNSILKQQAQLWSKEEMMETKRMEKLLDMMVREMRENNGCGIAAPQIGIPKQLFLFELESVASNIDCPNFPLTAFFNPTIEIIDDDYIVGKKTAGSSKNLLNLTKYKRLLQSPSTTLPRKPTSSNTITMWESCLSVPNYYGHVTRSRRCIINFTDISGKARAIEADGIIAACLQHENDHLLGRVFIERLKNGVNDLVHTDEMKPDDFNEVFKLSGDFQITK